MSTKFPTNYTNRPVSKPKVLGGPILVERAGYMSAKKRVEQMINAGERLAEYRRAVYDSDHVADLDNMAPDPTRKGIDMAEASLLYRETMARLKREKAAQEAAKASEEAKKALEEAKKPPREEVA